MDHRAAQHILAVPAPMLRSLIWGLLKKPSQSTLNSRRYFLVVLKRALMNKMMKKAWKTVPLTIEMRARALHICRTGARNGNQCLLNWYIFFEQEKFFVGSWGRATQNSCNYRFFDELVKKSKLTEESAEQYRVMADYAYNIGLIGEAFRLYALAYRFK
jgi:hypothetical protein